MKENMLNIDIIEEKRRKSTIIARRKDKKGELSCLRLSSFP